MAVAVGDVASIDGATVHLGLYFLGRMTPEIERSLLVTENFSCVGIQVGVAPGDTP
jgi:hypothetical protein